MGSSAKTGKKIFYGSQEQFLDKTVIWDRTPPYLYIKCSVYMWGRAQGSQIFKWNSIISIRSKVIGIFSDFIVPMWSPWSPHHSHCPPITPQIPTPPTPTPLGGGGPQITKNAIRFELIEIFNSISRFEICGDSPTYGWVQGLVGGWVDGWVNGWHQVKSLKIK